MPECALPGGDGRGMVLFIHGLWMHATSWQPWAELFDRSGYDCVLAAWPGELATAGDCRADRAQLGRDGLGPLCGQLAWLAASLPTPPIVIGHDAENQLRVRLLTEQRGYGNRTELFGDFPADVRWQWMALTPTELATVRYIDYSYWNELSGGSRLAADAAPLGLLVALVAPPVSL